MGTPEERYPALNAPARPEHRPLKQYTANRRRATGSPISVAACSDPPTAYWQLNEGDGEQASDATGNGHTLSLDGATWTEGVTAAETPDAEALAATSRADGDSQTALHFDGTGQNATTSLPELDTTASYSVSAWVRMDELPEAYATVASADGLFGRSAFFLQYGQPTEGFAFSFPDGPRAIAPITPELGSWYHLVGVRDAEADTISLYLNGTEAATVDAKAGAAQLDPSCSDAGSGMAMRSTSSMVPWMRCTSSIVR